MARRRGAGDPIPSLELLYQRRRAAVAPAKVRAWAAENLEMLEAHAAGLPCRDGRDGTADAAQLLAMSDEP